MNTRSSPGRGKRTRSSAVGGVKKNPYSRKARQKRGRPPKVTKAAAQEHFLKVVAEMRHSDTPNVCLQEALGPDGVEFSVVTIRHIKAGEELTIDRTSLHKLARWAFL